MDYGLCNKISTEYIKFVKENILIFTSNFYAWRP